MSLDGEGLPKAMGFANVRCLMAKKESSLDRVLGRIDNLDTVTLANLAKKLARERALLETIFNTAREGMLLIDSEGIVHFANLSAQRLVGLKPSDIGDTTLWRLVPGLRESLNLPSRAEGAPTVSSREMELNYPERRFVRLYVVPMEQGEDGLESRYVVILSDITSEKLSIEETIESEKISSILLLAAGVAHELGNPLNSITIHLQLIERQLKQLEESEAAKKLGNSAEICRQEVERLDGIIKNFLEAIRPQPPDLKPINLHDALEEVLKVQGSELSDRHISVEVDMGNEPPIANADKNQVKQVFFNVIKNAVEAMEPGGSLSIKTRGDESSIYMQFGDSGSGIRQEDLPKVFQPYHTSKKSGTGLGLMIVQRIMREHGGQVGIDSQEDVGTVVTLEFPKKDKKFRMLEG